MFLSRTNTYEYERAGKKKLVRVSKTGVYIKPFWYSVQTAIAKSEKYPKIRNRLHECC